MPSLIPGFEYDLFISYRQKDNKYDGWVTEFVTNLKKELEATFKEDISIYFDENPHDGLLETHDVDQSLNEKVKCLVFIPIVSQTYCDPKSFAWQKEFLAFRNFARSDGYGLDIKLSGGNVAKRILPIRIHEIDATDKKLFEEEIGGVIRPIDFIFKAGGVNRPLRDKDDNVIKDHRQPFYRDNINKVANAVKEIILGISNKNDGTVVTKSPQDKPEGNSFQRFGAELLRRNVIRASMVYMFAAFLIWKASGLLIAVLEAPENLLSFVSTILLIFFPVAIIMAWLFERSPSGFVRYGTAQAMDNPFTIFQRKPLTGDFSILILMVLALALYFLSPRENQNGDNSQPLKTLRLSLILEHEPSWVAISQDGLSIVYTVKETGKPVYVRNLNEEFSRPLASTEGGSNPFFSPNGKTVGYFKSEALYKTSVDRSDPLKITDIMFGGNAYWDSPDTIMIGADLGSKLYKVSVTSGQVVSVTFPGQNFSNPSPIMGTEYLLGSDENSNIIALSPTNGNNKIVLPNGGWQPKYMEPGYLVYALQGRLLATHFDRTSLIATGYPIPVLSKVQTYGLTYSAFYDIAKNGTLIYSSATPDDLCKLVWVNERGIVIDSLALPADFYGAFSLSPDGRKVAYGFNGPNSDIWIFDMATGRNQKLTEEGVNQYPIWSPDGSWVTYSSYLDGKWDIYRQNFNSTQQREKLTSSGKLKRPGTWSPDGRLLTFYEVVEGEADNMFLLSMDNKKITAPWRNTKEGDRQPRFSPDGKFACYQTTQSGGGIYVEPFPATGQRWQISNEGVDAIWSSLGDKIFCRTTSNSFFQVELSYDNGFSASPPKEMFRGPFIDVFDKSFDVSRDGKKFLVLKAVNDNERINRLEVIVNWPEELKKVIKSGKE